MGVFQHLNTYYAFLIKKKKTIPIDVKCKGQFILSCIVITHLKHTKRPCDRPKHSILLATQGEHGIQDWIKGPGLHKLGKSAFLLLYLGRTTAAPCRTEKQMPQGKHLRTIRDTAGAVRAVHQFSTCTLQVC